MMMTMNDDDDNDPLLIVNGDGDDGAVQWAAFWPWAGVPHCTHPQQCTALIPYIAL